jgi:hypothetical protein
MMNEEMMDIIGYTESKMGTWRMKKGYLFYYN